MTPPLGTSSRRFEVGTTGWTASDLEIPEIEREWFRGRYEIVEGVLTKMPAAYFAGGEALFNLMKQLDAYFTKHGPSGSFSVEVDIIIDEPRVAVVDAVFLTKAERTRQEEATRRAGKSDATRTRILVPPTLVIESVSPGHELHDRRTKARWYGEFGVPNYWILDAYEKMLECLVLRADRYETDVRGGGKDVLRPSSFQGAEVHLGRVFVD